MASSEVGPFYFLIVGISSGLGKFNKLLVLWFVEWIWRCLILMSGWELDVGDSGQEFTEWNGEGVSIGEAGSYRINASFVVGKSAIENLLEFSVK